MEKLEGSRTDGGRLNHVADSEPLDGLVLGNAASAVGAAHRLDVAAAVLVTTAKESISHYVPSKGVRGFPSSPFSIVRQCAMMISCFLSRIHLCCILASIILFFIEMRRRHCGDVEWDNWDREFIGRNRSLLVRPLLDHFDGFLCERVRRLRSCDGQEKGEVAYG